MLPIGIEEMERTIAGKPEFILTRDVDGKPVVEFAKCGDPPPCVWYHDGEWWTKNPDEPTIDAMCRLASHLDARVRGDELETYRSSTDAYSHPDDAALHEEARFLSEKHRSKKPALRFWIIGGALVLGILAGKCSRKRQSETGSAAVGSFPTSPLSLQIGQAHW